MENIPTPQQRVERAREIYSAILNYTTESDDFELMGKVLDKFAKHRSMLKEKYGHDVNSHAMFHVLGGSGTVVSSEVIYEDFPGDESVEKLLEEMASELHLP